MTVLTTESQGRPSSVEPDRGRPRVAVLGAGPAGLAAALHLARDRGAEVTLFERGQSVGGNAGSFKLDGIWCDFGSHRLHPVAEPRVLSEIASLLGDDLRLRPRHGRIRLQDRWIHFPLKPLDLAARLPGNFTAGLVWDSLLKPFRSSDTDDASFASVLRTSLGQTMCDSFYFPYVRKLWGLEPDQLAATLADRRVSGNSLFRIAGKILQQIPGVGAPTSGRFYYPREGYGQICERFYQAATAIGVESLLGAEVTSIVCQAGRARELRFVQDGREGQRSFDAVWSTLPVSVMVRMLEPEAPAPVVAASHMIRFRGMVLIYLVLDQDRFSEYDAHYFPEPSVPISRMSEPKNYSGVSEPVGRTVLCAELPSDPGEPHWELTDAELGARLSTWLERVDLPIGAPIRNVTTRRLRFAYPVYDRDYEAHFQLMDDWLAGVEGLISFGRQGLFAHDNTHHAMAMALAAVDCFSAKGSFDPDKWSRHREEFKSHVVED